MNAPVPNADILVLQRLFHDKSVVVAENYDDRSVTGTIDEEPQDCSGVWGYEGCNIAVKIRGEWWPGSRVKIASGD